MSSESDIDATPPAAPEASDTPAPSNGDSSHEAAEPSAPGAQANGGNGAAVDKEA